MTSGELTMPVERFRQIRRSPFAISQFSQYVWPKPTP